MRTLKTATILAGLVGCGFLVGLCGECPAAQAVVMPHPDDATKQVEYFVERPEGTGPWPTIVLLHGHQTGARPGGRDFVDWGVLKSFADRGYLAVAVSQPGYGKSSGPPDFCGEFTQHAVSGVIGRLRADGLVRTDRVVLEGISRGALTAGLIAARDESIAGLVLISGVYDLPAYVADADKNAIRQVVAEALKTETGGTPEALRSRSVLPVAGRIKARTLILNGAIDDRTEPAQAQQLADAITHNGGTARAILYPNTGHKIPVELRNKDIDPFLEEVLGGAVSD